MSGLGRAARGRLVVKPKDLRGTMRRLWDLTRGHRKGLGWILLLSALASASAILSPLIIGRAVTAVDQGDPAMTILLTLLALYLCDWLVRFLQQYFMASVGQRIVHYIRATLFGFMKKLPLSFFDRRQHGELMSRLTNDVENISTTLSNSLTQLFPYGFTILGIC
jgi:ATP-binding cassette subfamily B protein